MCLDMALPEFCWPDVKQTVLMARKIQPDLAVARDLLRRLQAAEPLPP